MTRKADKSSSSTQEQALRKALIQENIEELCCELLTLPPGINGQIGPEISLFSSSLRKLGPVFEDFTRYLGSRTELLRPEVCQSLLAQTALENKENSSLHSPSSEWADRLVPDPLRSTNLFHIFRWQGQPDIYATVINSRFLTDWQKDQGYLDLLLPAMKRLWPGQDHAGILKAYRAHIERSIDLEATSNSFRHFAERSNAEPLIGPQFHLAKIAGEFSTSSMLSFREPVSRQTAGSTHQTLRKVFASEPEESLRDTVARTLCLSWLNHTLRGLWYPEEPSFQNLGLAPDDSLTILGGTLGTLTPETQNFFLRYFGAVASNQPDLATEIMVSVLRPTRQARSLREIRDLFRQIVPFRDGQINTTNELELFAEHVVCQWRIILESGYRATSEYLSVIRSFATIALLAHELSPKRDIFKDSLYELRWTDSLSSFRQLFTIGSAVQQGQDWLSLMMEVPEKMNLLAKDQGLNNPLQTTQATPPSPYAPAWLKLIAHFIVIGIMGWLLQIFLQQDRNHTFLIAATTLTIIGTCISLIRCLSGKSRSL